MDGQVVSKSSEKLGERLKRSRERADKILTGLARAAHTDRRRRFGQLADKVERIVLGLIRTTPRGNPAFTTGSFHGWPGWLGDDVEMAAKKIVEPLASGKATRRNRGGRSWRADDRQEQTRPDEAHGAEA